MKKLIALSVILSASVSLAQIINPPDLSSYATTVNADNMTTKTNWDNTVVPVLFVGTETNKLVISDTGSAVQLQANAGSLSISLGSGSITENATVAKQTLLVNYRTVTNLLATLNPQDFATNAIRKGSLAFCLASNSFQQTPLLDYPVVITTLTLWDENLIGYVADWYTCGETNPLSRTLIYTGMVYTASAVAMTNQTVNISVPADRMIGCIITNGAVTNASARARYTY